MRFSPMIGTFCSFGSKLYSFLMNRSWSLSDSLHYYVRPIWTYCIVQPLWFIISLAWGSHPRTIIMSAQYIEDQQHIQCSLTTHGLFVIHLKAIFIPMLVWLFATLFSIQMHYGFCSSILPFMAYRDSILFRSWIVLWNDYGTVWNDYGTVGVRLMLIFSPCCIHCKGRHDSVRITAQSVETITCGISQCNYLGPLKDGTLHSPVFIIEAASHLANCCHMAISVVNPP